MASIGEMGGKIDKSVGPSNTANPSCRSLQEGWQSIEHGAHSQEQREKGRKEGR